MEINSDKVTWTLELLDFQIKDAQNTIDQYEKRVRDYAKDYSVTDIINFLPDKIKQLEEATKTLAALEDKRATIQKLIFDWVKVSEKKSGVKRVPATTLAKKEEEIM